MIGPLSLWIALIFCTFGIFAPIASIALRRDYLKYTYWAAYAAAGSLSVAIIFLAVNIIASNFQYEYVAEYSNRALGLFYKISAIYAGQAGSLLFWGWLVAIFTAIVAFTHRDDSSDFIAFVMSVLFSIIWFFVFLVSFAPWAQETSIYKGAGGFLGFMLLIAIVITIGWTIATSIQKRNKGQSYAWVIYCGTALAAIFFLVRMGVLNPTYMGTNPFELIPAGSIPPDGQGLNPLLQNYGMIFHPPTLYLGFAGFSVPFAYAIAALLTKQLDGEWLKMSRKWIIFSWLLLGIGIILGAQWAYMELGWGGYWAWDPVENASLMPWLVGTALVHSALAQRRKDIFKIWNMFLVVITFALCVYGTYLTRSGVVASVHSFGESPLGNFILSYVVVAFIGSVVLISSRFKNLTSDKHVDNFISKEFALLATNFLLAVAAIIVFYGTDYSIIVNVIHTVGSKLGVALPLALSAKQEVGKKFYESLMGPLSVIFFAVMAFCPLISWKKMSIKKLIVPTSFVSGLVVIVAPLYAIGKLKHPLAVGGIGVLALMAFVSTQEIFKSFWGKKKYNWDKVGAFVVHVGMALAFIGIIVSSVFNLSKSVTLNQRGSTNLGRFTFQYEGVNSKSDSLKQSAIASVSLWEGQNQLSLLEPSIDSYYSSNQQMQGQTTSEPGLFYNLKEDVYITLTNISDNGKAASFKFLYNPMVIWFWIGGIIMSLGGLILLFSTILPKSVFASSTGAQVPVSEIEKQGLIYCTNCGNPYNKGEECKSCNTDSGTEVEFCSKCGKIRKDGAKFCNNCGSKY
jgi:cytochrome c-type biogenesis protein CcmF